MVPDALLAGLTFETYWDLTYGEILDVFRAYNKKQEEELKLRLTVAHAEADLVGSSVARLMDKNSKYPTLFDAFPEVFKEEKKAYDAAMEEKRWKLQMARLMEYSQAHNAKRQHLAKDGE